VIRLRVVILGGHGKIALRLLRLLAENGHSGVGIVRSPDHVGDLEEIGAEAVVLDIENEDIPPELVSGADAVVMAAGAGPGSGLERKRTVDYGGAVKLIRAAESAGVTRYLMISATGAQQRATGDEGMAPYLRAKHDADEELMQSSLEYTIVRPHLLTDAEGKGRIEVGERLERGEIPRDDVAATLYEALGEQKTVNKVFDQKTGDTPIPEALASL
jgi:uncharacterized protein YbjT (DUF2867 family)